MWVFAPCSCIQLFLQTPPSVSVGRTNVWAQDSHRLAGARTSHTHRICKDFNNEPLTSNHRDRSGVNKGPHTCKWRRAEGPYKSCLWPGASHTHSLSHQENSQVTQQHRQHGQILLRGLAGPEPQQHGAHWGHRADLQTPRPLRGAAASPDFWQRLPPAETQTLQARG